MLGPQARPTVPAYIAAKEGLRALTRALAVEVGADGILVNAIAPGYIATELNTALLEDLATALYARSELYRIVSKISTFVTFASLSK